LEEDLKSDLTQVEIIKLAFLIIKIFIQMKRYIKVAQLDEHLEHLSNNTFAENIMRNRGFNYRTFTSRSVAIEWLEES